MTDMTQRIRNLAKKRGVSLSYICQELGLTKVYFNYIEKNNAEIPYVRLEKIAEVLQTTPAYLRGETDDVNAVEANIKKAPSTEAGSIRPDQMERIIRLLVELPEEKRPEAERYLRYLIETADDR